MKIGSNKSFTLIELLIVVAILGVLAAGVTIILNPVELIAQSHDANRFSDLDSLNRALAAYQAGNGAALPGSANTLYISIPDTSSTCSDITLPTLPTGWSYACSANPKKIDGGGWIPINFTTATGTSISSLPIDPLNTPTNGLYYAYNVNGNQYELTAILESQKYRVKEEVVSPIQYYPGVLAEGTSFSISPLFNPSGLVSYWKLDEGGGTSAIDSTGNGNTGTWAGTSNYVAGKVGSWAGYFDGSSNQVSVTTTSALDPIAFTLSMWVYEPTGWASGYTQTGDLYGQGYEMILDHNNVVDWNIFNNGPRYQLSGIINPGTWSLLTGTYNGTSMNFYVNGQNLGGISATLTYTSPTFYIDSYVPASGVSYMDDVRFYNRVLSASEIQAIYNSQK
jgi:prepilin-type N-terminal cleavage/methylation domain-containing protein